MGKITNFKEKKITKPKCSLELYKYDETGQHGNGNSRLDAPDSQYVLFLEADKSSKISVKSCQSHHNCLAAPLY